MKLLVVTPYFYPKVGGLENYAWHICRGLHKTFGWEIVAIAANHEEKKYKEEVIEGIKVYRLPYWFKLSNTPINLGWFIDIRKIIKKEKPDIINGHTPVPFISDVAGIVSYVFKVPFVLTYQNDLVKNNFLDIIFKMYYKTLGFIIFTISKVIIVSNQYYADNSIYLQNFLSKVQVVSPGVFLTNTTNTKNSCKNSVLFVGQLDKTHIHKGLFNLIDAFELTIKNIQDAKLIIVGKGDYIQEYKKYIKNKSLINNVIFLGYVPDDELQNIYSSVDIVTLPSISQSEGFGMILIEAGAHKKPVIGSNVGGIPSIIKDNINGFLIEPANVDQLAEKIVLLLSDNELAHKMGQQGYELVSKNFQWKDQIKKTDVILKQLI